MITIFNDIEYLFVLQSSAIVSILATFSVCIKQPNSEITSNDQSHGLSYHFWERLAYSLVYAVLSGVVLALSAILVTNESLINRSTFVVKIKICITELHTKNLLTS